MTLLVPIFHHKSAEIKTNLIKEFSLEQSKKVRNVPNIVVKDDFDELDQRVYLERVRKIPEIAAAPSINVEVALLPPKNHQRTLTNDQMR